MITYLIYNMLTVISKVSLGNLYLLARLFKHINNLTFKYRQKITKKNIKSSFPELTHKEIENIASNFYTFFFENIFEIIKSISLTESEIIKKVQIKNIQLLNESIKTKKPIVLISSHYGNWEWAFLRISLISNINLHAVYKPLSNSIFNNIIYRIRSKFGGKLINLNKWKYFILKNRRKAHSFLFISDQVPSSQKYGRRINFLNQSTLFHEGSEKTAKLLNADVFYIDLMQIKKGKYIIEFRPISKYNTTEEYAKLLEDRIKKQPKHWLWSHDRWKR